MILNVQSKKVEPDIAILEMTGRITMGSDSQQIEWELAELLKVNHKKVIFDLTEVTFLESTGYCILVMCHAKLKKAGGALRIAGARGDGGRNAELDQCEQNCGFLSDCRRSCAGLPACIIGLCPDKRANQTSHWGVQRDCSAPR